MGAARVISLLPETVLGIGLNEPAVTAPREPVTAPKAVVLAGGPGTAKFDLANCYPKLVFPMADGRPLLTHMLSALRDQGVTEVALTLSDRMNGYGAVLDLLEHHDDPRLRVHTFVDDGLRGTAGALKPLARFVGNSRFLVVGSNLWLEDFDLSAVHAAHTRQDAMATVVVEDAPGAGGDLEYMSLGADGQVEGVRVLHHSREAERPVSPAGIYLFEPAVLDFIDGAAYTDIKEQLLPELAGEGRRVQTHRLEQPLSRINDLTGYRDLNRNLLSRLVESNGLEATEYFGGVSVGRNTRISPSAYILGPVMIGDDCVIEDGAQIIGPTIICDGTQVSPRVLVRESFVWRGCRLMPRARISHSVITEACSIAEDEIVENAVVIEGKAYENGVSRNAAASASGLAPAHRDRRRRRRQAAYRAAKRCLDVAVSAVGLVLLAPVFLIIAAAIKLDCKGPVFFRQQRCGQDGRDFKMVKFRTMSTDAERRKSELMERNEAAGPMFKMEKDPRVTRVGDLLRRTSLDELPQLWNVLKGDMSLVGPRPLAIDEMDWSPKWRDLRLQVKPGVTGLWQVYGRNETGFEPWIEHDITYVRRQSLLLDLRILVKTLTAFVN